MARTTAGYSKSPRRHNDYRNIAKLLTGESNE